MNFYAVLVAALTTLVVGSIWYSPVLFGNAWMKETGLTEEELKKGSMLKIFGLTYIFSLMITMTLMSLTIHQSGAVGMVGGPPLIASAKPSFAAFMADYGTAYRTFKHGALHGFMAGLFLALPIIGTNALYERRSWKYTLVTGGFWVVCFTIMGGIICAWK